MAYLVVMNGDSKGQQFELPSEGMITLGREEDNSIAIDGAGISGHHASLAIGAGAFLLKDEGSTNGTSVNDEAIESAPLYRGDVMSLGGVVLMIEGEDVPARANDISLGGGVEGSSVEIRIRNADAPAASLPAEFTAVKRGSPLLALLVVAAVAIAAAAFYFFIIAFRN